MKKNLTKVLISLGIILVVIYLQKSMANLGNDPDRYYHFSLSRYMVEEGVFFPKVFPAVENLGWNEYFPDKEFLYHQISSMGYRIAGDSGVLYASLGISVLVGLVFFFYASSVLPLSVALGAVAYLYLAPSIFFRLLLVRPHVLAVLLFLGILISIAKRNRISTFILAVLFALSYHATYVPGICFLIGLVVYALIPNEENRWLRGVCFSGLMGLAIGTLINPYFPSNIIGSWQIAQIPFLMQGALQGISFGDELYPIQTNVFIRTMFPSILVVIGAIYYLGNKGSKNLISSSETLYFVLCTLFTLLLAFLNRRGSEYFVPCSGILLCHLLSKISFEHWKAKAIWLSFCALILGLFLADYFENSKQAISPHVESSLRAADSLPVGPVKVFNCEWDRAPYIMYKRPMAKVVDLLDPSLLFFSDEELFFAKSRFNEGKIGDPSGVLQSEFKADFVYCANPVVVGILQKDPNFQQISPRAKPDASPDLTEPSVFKIRREGDLPFIKEADGRFFKRESIFRFRELNPKSKESFSEKIVFENSSFLNLETVYRNKWIEGSKDSEFANCALITPTKAEISRFAGSRFIGLGGGRSLRLWVNDKPVFETKSAYQNPALVKVLVPLERPVSPADKIEIMSCSSSKGSYWGIAVSFWTNDSISSICRWKSEKTGSNKTAGDWQFQGEIQETCLGPIASRSLNGDLLPPKLMP